MKIGYLITARMKSTRLPEKLILNLEGKEVIRWMILRLKLVKKLNVIIICTSTNPHDDMLEKIAREEGIKIFRGSENDVIQRLSAATNYFNLDYALNITADCPLISIEYIEKIIDTFEKTDADLIRTLDLPHGFFSYGLKPEALNKICKIKDEEDTEVWGRYFTDTGLFNVYDLQIPEDIQRPLYRLTLDYLEDFNFFKAVFSHFGQDTFRTNINDIICFLDNNPDVVEINSNCAELYKKRWTDQNKIKLK